MEERYLIIINNTILEEYKKYYFTKYPRRKKFPIKSPIHPSINEWMIMKRPQMNKLKQDYGEFIQYVVAYYNMENLYIDNCRITITYYFPNKRRQDCDNRTPKFYFDGLVESGLLIDDSFTHVNPLIIYGGYDKQNSRTEILIEVLK